MSDAVIAHQVYKKFGKNRNGQRLSWLMRKNQAEDKKEPIVAVGQITFRVKEGEIFRVLGPNSSGKSTLIRLIATLLLPDAGQLEVFGFDVVAQPRQG